MFELNSTISKTSIVDEDDVKNTKSALRDFGLYPKDKEIAGFTDNELFDGIEGFQKTTGLKVDGVMRPKGETETRMNEALSVIKEPPKPKEKPSPPVPEKKPNRDLSSLRTEKKNFESHLQNLRSKKNYILSQINQGETKIVELDRQYRKDATRYGDSFSPNFFPLRGGMRVVGKSIDDFLNGPTPTGSDIERQMLNIQNIKNLIDKHKVVLLDIEEKIKDTQVKIRMIEREINVIKE